MTEALEVVARARSLALRAHDGQRYGDLPYSAHLDAVAELVAAFGAEASVVAYLHDVLEDTEVVRADIALQFGEHIADLVEMVSDDAGPSRAVRKRSTHARLATCPRELSVALVVKAADRLANLRACVRFGPRRLLAMYRREHDDFRRATWRAGLCDELWRDIDRLAGESPPGGRPPEEPTSEASSPPGTNR